MQLSLYRAERPEVFEDIIGQKHIVRILKNQIRTGTVSQAYLFSGTHGTGKTSTARILAKAVNCLEGIPGSENGAELPCGHCANCEAIREGRFVDCIELDAASNNGVDDLRAIIDMVKYPPSVGRYKVYIIDEVHMLSPAAENAFLKTLEEPPEHAIFILATTDPQKVRSTIRSRCMQLNFKRVSEEDLVAGMDRICSRRGVEATRDALVTIASRADGSVRDALSILEQCMAAGDTHLDKSLVLEYTGAAGEDFFIALTDAVRKGDIGKVFIYIDEIIKRGKDAKQILKDWLTHYRNLMVVKYVSKPERIIGSSVENSGRLKKQADALELSQIEQAVRLLSEYINISKYSERPRILLETAAVRLAGGIETVQTAARPATVQTRTAERKTDKPAASVSVRENTAKEDTVKDAVSEPDDYEPPVMIQSAPREVPGDPEEMWNIIAGEISRNDRSFMSFVAKHSKGTEFDSGELVVTVKPNKMRLANDKLGEITRAAKGIYGPEIFVTLRGGDPDEDGGSRPVVSEQEASRIIDEDANLNDVLQDVENLFGIKPEVSN
ncbi:MAG: DNA polymerase III subunit gamma/tau [Mogibacterium sp.]|nr:DNA polymerase III subunit gamma/tau [Mogibacterium sp.]